MGNNSSRPNAYGGGGVVSTRQRHSYDRGTHTKRAYSTTRGKVGKRSKYDEFYDDDDYDDGGRDFLPRQPYGAGGAAFPQMQMPGPHQGYYVNPQYVGANGQPLVFPQPQMQPGMNPVIPPMPMNGAMPTAGNPFPNPPMNMPEPVIPGSANPGAGAGAGFGGTVNPEAPVIPPLPGSIRRRTGTPYHAPVDPYDSSSDEDYDQLTAEARERLQPRLAPGQYGPHDGLRERMRTPGPALRRTGEHHHHRRTESSPAAGYRREPMYDDPPVIPHMTGGQYVGQPGVGMSADAGMGVGAGAEMGMGTGIGMSNTMRSRSYVPPPRSPNPLPPPPKDILQSSPYVRLIRELRKPIDDNMFFSNAPAIHTVGAVNVGPTVLPGAQHHHHHRQGTRSSKEKKRKGLFRSLLGGRKSDDEYDRSPESGGLAGSVPTQTLVGGQSVAIYPIVQHLPDGSTQLIYNPPLAPGMAPQAHGMPMMAGAGANTVPPPGYVPGAAPAAAAMNQSQPVVIPPGSVGSVDMLPHGPAPTPVIPLSRSPGPGRMPSPQPAPPPPPPPAIKIHRDSNSELAGLLHFSPHRVLYDKKLYPTAMHLLEAFKFLPEHPDFADQIRSRSTFEEARAVAEGLKHYWRRDWREVFQDKLDEALYHKLTQHPDLRALLLQTGVADIIFSDRDTMWGDGGIGVGSNLLGLSLMRVRNRLRAEGFDD